MGNVQKQKTQTRRRRDRRRPNRAVVGLLTAIAVLLGFAVFLLPDGRLASIADVDPSSVPSEPTRDPESETRENQTIVLGDPREREIPGNEPTETYPAGESPTPDAGLDGGDAEYWWLPGPAAEDAGALSIVLDDAGNSLDGYELYLDLPYPLTFAVLPQLNYSVQAAAMAIAAGHDVILHQPMEALGGAEPGPGAIRSDMTSAEIVEMVLVNLATVPGAVGANNHMGSLGTTDPALMRSLLGALHEKGLFYLDSRTSAASVAAVIAAEVNVPFAERKVFLDNSPDRESILASLTRALELTAAGEPVVMIGHVSSGELADVLEQVYPALVEHGYRFARVADHVVAREVARR